MTPEQALTKIIEGNRRFESGLRAIEAMTTRGRRQELAATGQKPFAMVLACADSRVPAEMIFDCGLGDLFVVRVAGNIVAPSLIASLEFAAASFGTPLCIVMGHTKCGAVAAGLNAERTGKRADTDHIQDLLREIRPAVVAARHKGCEDEDMETEVGRENVRNSLRALSERSRVLRELVATGKLGMVGAMYDLFSGRVEIMDTPLARQGVDATPRDLAAHTPVARGGL